MAKQHTYSMRAGDEVLGEHKSTNPTKALREFFGDALVSQDGRYGKLADGRHCRALTVEAGRTRYADHGTTRLLHGKEVR